MNSLRRLAVLIAALGGGGGGIAPPLASAAAPGLNVSAYDDAQPALVMGAKQVRFFVRWRDFEPGGAAEFTAAEGPSRRTGITTALAANVDRVLSAGATPIMVVIGAPGWAASGERPRDPDEYAAFIGELARWLATLRDRGQPRPVYEVWNEPDAPEFWGETPDPAFYTAMLRASYATVKAGDPGATVLTGPTTGNNYAWIESLYARGAKGAFDGVAVHTGTACLMNGPDAFYREPSGRLGQYAFLGYREVRASMLANGDDKPIWMTELGWSSTGGGPDSCARGEGAAKKPSGVSETDQAAFLSKAFRCLAQDPYVIAATWFTLRDVQDDPSELGSYGLLRRDGSAKPARDAFAGAAERDIGPCGDFDPPVLNVIAPVEGQRFVNELDIRASATDAGAGLARISYAYDGGKAIQKFTDTLLNGGIVALTPWQSPSRLALGPHRIEVTALDALDNAVRKVVTVTKVPPRPREVRVRLLGRVTCKRRTCTLKGSLVRPAGAPPIGGKVVVEWQRKHKKRKLRRLIRGLKPASTMFTFKARLKHKGSWRVRVRYAGAAPYKGVTSRYVTFRLK